MYTQIKSRVDTEFNSYLKIIFGGRETAQSSGALLLTHETLHSDPRSTQLTSGHGHMDSCKGTDRGRQDCWCLLDTRQAKELPAQL